MDKTASGLAAGFLRTGAVELETAQLMECPGVKWLRANRGLQSFTFEAPRSLCYWCSRRNKPKSEQLRKDLGQNIRTKVGKAEK